MIFKSGFGNTFLFSLRDDNNFAVLKSLDEDTIRILKKEDCLNFHSLCAFGAGSITIVDQCDTESNDALIDSYYEVPQGFVKFNDYSYSLLKNNSRKFLVEEIEVFKLCI